MGTVWAIIALVAVAAILMKMFKKMALALLLFVLAEIIVIIIWPQILTSLAELAVKVRELIGG